MKGGDLMLFVSLHSTEKEQKILSELYVRYREDMYITALDVTHNAELAEEAVLSVFTELSNHTARIPHGKEPSYIKICMCADARAAALKIVEDKKSNDALNVSISDIKESDIYSISSKKEIEREDKASYKEAIAVIEKMPSDIRRTMISYYVSGESVYSIAKRTGTSTLRIKRRINKGLTILRRYFDVEADDLCEKDEKKGAGRK